MKGVIVMDKHSNKLRIKKEVEKDMKIIDMQLEHLAKLSINELKKAYENYDVSWIYIAELKERGYITKVEMNFITSSWE